MSYQIRYAEDNRRSRSLPWSIRQTGIYHHHSALDGFDLYIFINPLEHSMLEKQLSVFSEPNACQETLSSIAAAPQQIHLISFASYISNWRWCLDYWGEKFQEMVSLVYEKK